MERTGNIVTFSFHDDPALIRATLVGELTRSGGDLAEPEYLEERIGIVTEVDEYSVAKIMRRNGVPWRRYVGDSSWEIYVHEEVNRGT